MARRQDKPQREKPNSKPKADKPSAKPKESREELQRRIRDQFRRAFAYEDE